jgi:hypothetical protein
MHEVALKSLFCGVADRCSPRPACRAQGDDGRPPTQFRLANASPLRQATRPRAYITAKSDL